MFISCCVTQQRGKALLPLALGENQATTQTGELQFLGDGQAWPDKVFGSSTPSAYRRDYLKGVIKNKEGWFFIWAESDRIRGNCSKPIEERCRLDFRVKFFPVRVVRHRHTLAREAVDAPALKVQGQAGQGLGAPALVDDIPGCGRALGTGGSLEFLPS